MLTQAENKIKIAEIIAHIKKLNREKVEFEDCPGSLAEIELDIQAARARLRALRAAKHG